MKAILALVFLAMPLSGEAKCRQALALGLDVSGSVDAVEYDLQLRGIAYALRQQSVQDAFLAFPDAPVRLYIYEWSGLFSQTEIQPWVDVTSPDILNDIATFLETPESRPRQAETAVGLGLLFGAKALWLQRECFHRTLDISSDGKSNTGPSPLDLQRDALLEGLTINALVIGIRAPVSDVPRSDSVAELSQYYREQVIRGPDAFVEVAIGYTDYARAIELKLLRELQTLPVTFLGPFRSLGP
ncbi:MAG: DUF1194 domain-containing protein [Deltaproteobacteria bacterium]